METDPNFNSPWISEDHYRPTNRPPHENMEQHIHKGFLGSKTTSFQIGLFIILRCFFIPAIFLNLLIIGSLSGVVIVYGLGLFDLNQKYLLTGFSLGFVLLIMVAYFVAGFLILFGALKINPKYLTASLYVMLFIILSRMAGIILHCVEMVENDIFNLESKYGNEIASWNLTAITLTVIIFLIEIVMISITCITVYSFAW